MCLISEMMKKRLEKLFGHIETKLTICAYWAIKHLGYGK